MPHESAYRADPSHQVQRNRTVSALALAVIADGERTVSHVGQELGLDSGTVSPLLRRLERRGLVARRRSSTDERVVVVGLTAEGERIREGVSDAVGCLVPEFLSTGAHLPELVASLRDITAQMKQLTAARRAG